MNLTTSYTESSSVFLLNGTGKNYFDLVSWYLIANETERVVDGFLRLMSEHGSAEGFILLPDNGRESMVEYEGKRIHILSLKDGADLFTSRALSLIPSDCVNVNIGDEWLVAVTGDVVKPGIYSVNKNTSYGELVGELQEEYVILAGNPLSGNKVFPDERVKKGVNLILVLKPEHKLASMACKIADFDLSSEIKKIKSLCNQCQICSDYCPANNGSYGLKPHIIMREIQSGYVSDLDSTEAVMSCADCGICNVVCPVGIFPELIIRNIRNRYTVEKTTDEVLLHPDPVREPAPFLSRDVFLERLDLLEYFNVKYLNRVEKLWS